MAEKEIYIKGARVNNLKNIEVHIPHNTLTVITGLSGSGKSTLAFDTIFAEGQRRYVESLSSYARQFLGRVSKPDADLISGIAPAIAIEQKVTSRNARSTVGTSTEIYDYLKLLYARIGRTYSPISGNEVRCYSTDDILQEIFKNLKDGSRVYIATPVVRKEGEGVIEKILDLREKGILRIYINGSAILLDDYLPSVDSSSSLKNSYAILDRMVLASDEDHTVRLKESISQALSFENHICTIISDGHIWNYPDQMVMDGITFDPPTEHLFSFNNPVGACPECEGYGRVTGIDENLVVPDKSKSIYDFAIACWRGDTMRQFRDALVNNAYKFDFPIHSPYYTLTSEQKQLLWIGNEHFMGLNEFFQYLEDGKRKIQYRIIKSRFLGKTTCPVCRGSRLKKEALYVKIGKKDISELVQMDVRSLREFFENLSLEEHEAEAAKRLLQEIKYRLDYLINVGLGYLTLDRLSSTLSGGESQRINLSTSLGSNLTGSLYILDEPSIGLHPHDTSKLIGVLKDLRDLGNTVIVVEHENEVIEAADYIVDMGPLAGEHGGEIVYSGSRKDISECKNSLTADYLLGRRSIPVPEYRRRWRDHILIHGARENNLKNIEVEIPLGVITCITGVSGSGKSTLTKSILYPALRRRIYETGDNPGDFDGLSGSLERIHGVEIVDQNPIGKSTRSNPVTYIKAYDEIRQLFADQALADKRGLTPASFSFNVPGGRCEECQGEGTIKIGMQFMADVTLTCESCGGHRFKDEILEIRYKDKNIYDVLNMSITEAIKFFGEEASVNSSCRKICERLQLLDNVGLGYIKLGQSSSTLSGGESQRVKLASFLSKESSGKNIVFIFDEPTTGLHIHDINKLMKALNALVSNGHTVIIIEHNVDVIKCADWVIDLGPKAGDEGGEVVAAGTPEEIAGCENSLTGKYLKKVLK